MSKQKSDQHIIIVMHAHANIIKDFA